MAKCFMTGVDVPIQDCYSLNIGVAYKKIKELKYKLDALQRLVTQLGTKDEIESYDDSEHKTVKKYINRLICSNIAAAISANLQETKLFTSWNKFHSEKHEIAASDRDLLNVQNEQAELCEQNEQKSIFKAI